MTVTGRSIVKTLIAGAVRSALLKRSAMTGSIMTATGEQTVMTRNAKENGYVNKN
jgi:hypothetical protein